MTSYAILGGNGVFGVHTAKYLLGAGASRVICVGRNPERGEPFTLGVGKGDPRYRYEQIHVVFEQDRLFELFDEERPEVIVNFAALAYATSWDKSWRYYETNVVSLSRMVEQLQTRAYMKRFIQIGTSELYGSVDRPVDEDAPLRPTSPYAVSKMAGDLHLESMWNVRRFPMNILRPSNAYGPGQLLYRVLPRAVLAGLAGERLPLEGGGTVQKSYIHAQDLAKAVHLIAEKAPFGRTYNAGADRPTSIRDLVAEVAAGLNMPLDQLAEVTEGRVGEDAIYWLDSTRIEKELGWRPSISLREGVADMIEWGRKYAADVADEPRAFVLRA